jgi:hypothetical protein
MHARDGSVSSPQTPSFQMPVPADIQRPIVSMFNSMSAAGYLEIQCVWINGTSPTSGASTRMLVGQ